jgi:hypothetical protein
VIPYIGNEKNLEYALVSKIVKLTRKDFPTVTLVTSADIPEKIISTLSQILAETARVSPFPVKEESKALPTDASLLLVIE